MTDLSEAILQGLRAAYLQGYEQGMNRAHLTKFFRHNGRYFIVGDGVTAATTCYTPDDVEGFNRRYAGAQSPEEQRTVIKSIIDWSVKTR